MPRWLEFCYVARRRDILTDYETVLSAVYEPSAYFSRVRAEARAFEVSEPARGVQC